MPLLALVKLDYLLGVDREHLVRVEHHAEEARVGLQERGKGKFELDLDR